MATDYNKIAKEYQASKIQPWQKYVEVHSLFKLAGDLTNKSVLDLACGDGFYTRQLKLRGANDVEGVDISAGMIQLAQQIEIQQPLGINYHVHDVLTLTLNKEFDFITASYLLNYAKSPDELFQFAEVIFKHLKPGGRFIAINSNPTYTAPVETTFKYGFTRENISYNEGGEIIYRFYQADGKHIEVVNYHHERATHNTTLEKAGFSAIEWHNTKLAKEGKQGFEPEFWEAILASQPVIGISCYKKL
ncbi:MAG: 2-polyprenyl-3-methyl-5-hydroxy-6-metoxy-1,4-benzoquinol methylase [Spirosomataceae bacterium]|jgi:2-polyprenyl-3-methyl-5-hydroxy-6-metoxy-1,4-benzoquinol methylase